MPDIAAGVIPLGADQMTIGIGRRQFITALGGVAVSWPRAAHAQQPEQMRHIGALMNLTADDPESQRRVAAFVQELQQLGWAEGRNVRIEIRWGAGDGERIRAYAAELVALAPDVILAGGAITVGPLQQASHAVPIVFAGVATRWAPASCEPGAAGRQCHRLYFL